MITKRVIVALDDNNLKRIIKIVSETKKEAYAFKIGYEFFINFGIEGYKKIHKLCPNIFLDLKLHDIPNTVEKGIKAINKLKPLLTTVHISGGNEMMKASIKSKNFTKVLGVSVLTSLDSKQIKKIYNETNIAILVKKLVKQAKINKLDGIICSPKEIKLVRKLVGKKFLIVTPGIRYEKNKVKKDDQKRTLTPQEAIKHGANLLVIGRPITKSDNPLKIIKNINRSIK
tara:strand:+ start:28 stop:714 length:687 start_codon:yes stop_codon:yes gene_type:complete